jgi:ATP-binding cassette subfamily C (CFTR/MRP) protein 1
MTGLNFSLGQRQLLALARALVRGSRIIVCDEATSSVDFETDALVQRSMKEGFEGRTLLVIGKSAPTVVSDRCEAIYHGCREGIQRGR